jgi:hypothetical protein
VSFSGLAAATSAAADPASPAPAPCSQNYNPYDYSEAAVAACGIATHPLTNKTPLPGGGDQYSYDLGNGITAILKTPPPGFDVANATKEQLSEYGLPQRPTDPVRLASWKSLTVLTPPPFMVKTSVSAWDNLDSRHWAGYEATAAANTFTSATAAWHEPSYGSSFCSTNDAVIWAGVGAEKAPQPVIGQSGTAYGLSGSGISNHQAWYEEYPIDNSIETLPLITAAGDFVSTYAAYAPSQNGWTGWVWDVTKSQIADWGYENVGYPVSQYYSGDGAEAIVERPGPAPGGGPTNLSNFGTMTFNDSAGNSTYLNQLANLHQVKMWSGSTQPFPFIGPSGTGISGSGDSGQPMAQAGSIGSQGAFSVTQMHCQ